MADGPRCKRRKQANPRRKNGKRPPQANFFRPAPPRRGGGSRSQDGDGAGSGEGGGGDGDGARPGGSGGGGGSGARPALAVLRLPCAAAGPSRGGCAAAGRRRSVGGWVVRRRRKEEGGSQRAAAAGAPQSLLRGCGADGAAAERGRSGGVGGGRPGSPGRFPGPFGRCQGPGSGEKRSWAVGGAERRGAGREGSRPWEKNRQRENPEAGWHRLSDSLSFFFFFIVRDSKTKLPPP